MGVKRVINGVHVVPMGMANAFLIEGQDGLTLIDAGFPGKEAVGSSQFHPVNRMRPPATTTPKETAASAIRRKDH